MSLSPRATSTIGLITIIVNILTLYMLLTMRYDIGGSNSDAKSMVNTGRQRESYFRGFGN